MNITYNLIKLFMSTIYLYLHVLNLEKNIIKKILFFLI